MEYRAAISRSSFALWDSWANKTTEAQGYFPPRSTYKYLRVRSRSEKRGLCDVGYRATSKLAGAFASRHAATLWWETSSSEWKQMIKTRLWAAASNTSQTMLYLGWEMYSVITLIKVRSPICSINCDCHNCDIKTSGWVRARTTRLLKSPCDLRRDLCV